MLSEMTQDFTEQAQAAMAKIQRMKQIGPEKYAAEERQRAWDERVAAEAAALNPGGVEEVTLDGGETVIVREPLAMAWARALGRVMKAFGPLTAIARAVMDDDWKRLDKSAQTGLALNLLAQYAGADYETTVAALFGALNALLGLEDGALEEKATPEDLVRLLLALVRVTKVERLGYFFGQLRAAAQASVSRPRAS